MDTFLAICQGIGLALATGLGGFAVPFVVAILAHLDAGIQLEGSGWSFIGSAWFIVVLAVLGLLAVAIRSDSGALRGNPGSSAAGGLRQRPDRRRASDARPGAAPAAPALLVVLAVLGAILFAGSLAEEDLTAWPGLVVGFPLALAAAALTRDVLAGAARRAAEDAVPPAAFAAAGGIVLALVAILISPLSLIVLAALVLLAASRPRRAARKHEGLRVLR